MALWFAAFLISMTWLYSVHMNLYAQPWAVALLTVAGVAVFALALRKKIDLSSVRPAWGLLIVPLVIGCVILDFPYTFGPLLLIGGLAGLLLCRFYRLSSVSAALLVSGAILTLQGLTYPLCRDFIAANPDAPVLTAPVYWLLKVTGLRCSTSAGTIYVEMMRNNWPFPTSWSKLGLFPLVQMLVAAVVLIPLFSEKMRYGIRTLWAFILSMGYMIVRYALMLLVFTYLMYFVGYFEDKLWIDIFWNRAITLLSFVPLVLIFARVFPLRRTGEAIQAGLQPAPATAMATCPLKQAAWFLTAPTDGSASAPKATEIADVPSRKALAFALALVGIFFFVGYVAYWDSGSLKKGRILLDEKHSGWEKSTRAYDTDWYGNESGYNYYSMSDLLSHYYELDKNTEKELTADLLKDYSVILLKNPSFPYSKDELDALLEFVRNGGGIFLMGEHTNVFGTSVPLNTIGRHFGFYFTYTSVFDMEEKFEQLWHVPNLMPSPLVQNQKDFLYATSCSVQRTSYFGRARNAAVAGGLWSLPIEYASGNFYPSVILRTDMTFGPMIQLVTGTMGKGRVIGFTDSTTFSNFSTQLPGKPELLLSSMNWLNHANEYNWLNTVFLALSLLCFAAALGLTAGTGRHLGTRLAILCAGVAIAAISMGFFTTLTHAAYPLPKPVHPYTKVVFEKQYSEYEIPVSGFVKDQQKSFAIFYQWVLRLQYFPFLKYTVDEALAAKPDVLVMINPTNIIPEGRTYVEHVDNQNVTKVLVPKLRRYMEAGGKLLLMDDATNEKSIATMLLDPYDMRIEGQRQSTPAGLQPQQQQPQMAMAVDTQGKTACAVPAGLAIKGGTPLLTTSDGKVVLAEKQVGKGKLLVMSASKRFCDAKMGYSQNAAPASADTLQAFWLQYALLTGLVEGDVNSEVVKVNKLSAKIGLR